MTTPAEGRPEDRARANIDRLLTAAGWLIQNRSSINIEAGRGVAIREFQLAPGHGFADYLLYIDGYAAGVIEAKKAGVPLVEVEIQSGKYSQGLPRNLPAPRRPLPFCYQSTGVETRFTNLLEPDARSRPVFGFHRPETLAGWLETDLKSPGSSLRGRLRIMPPLPREGLWDHQHRVIANLEQSLARNDPRALIHMTMGSGKTFTACNFAWRLIAHAGARRILFLVDRRTLGRQALNEFQQFSIPGDGDGTFTVPATGRKRLSSPLLARSLGHRCWCRRHVSSNKTSWPLVVGRRLATGIGYRGQLYGLCDTAKCQSENLNCP